MVVDEVILWITYQYCLMLSSIDGVAVTTVPEEIETSAGLSEEGETVYPVPTPLTGSFSNNNNNKLLTLAVEELL